MTKTLPLIANTLLVATATTAAVVPAITHEAPLAPWVGESTSDLDRPSALPTWNPAYADRFPGCRADANSEIPTHVLAVNLSGDLRTYTLDAVADRADSTPGHDDVWVVGFCY